MKVVVLAGGQGSRLWPLSKSSFPKQFLHFQDGESLLKKTLNRFSNEKSIDEIVIVTNQKYEKLVEKEKPSKKCKILIEPESKNTAPAIALAVKYLDEKGMDQKTPILVSPADHFLAPKEILFSGIKRVLPFVNQGNISIFGITPQKPETGYGYILRSNALRSGIFRVSSFVEKPNLSKAKEYFLSGKYLWNSGMFLFTSETFWKELKTHTPEIVALAKGVCTPENFHKMPSKSFDVAALEKSENVVVCPLSLQWSDVGSWDSVYDLLEKDENLNVKVGNVLSVDTKKSLIFAQKKLISTIGLRDLIIVETDEAIFIAKKGKLQGMKRLIEMIKQKIPIGKSSKVK